MTRRKALLAAGLGAAFVAVAAAAASVGVLPGDRPVRDALIRGAGPAVVAFLQGVNYAGDWHVVFPATVLLLLSPTIRRQWWLWLPAVIGAPWVGDHVIKYAVARARPEAASFGFPSGHTTAAAAYMGTAIQTARDLRPRGRVPLVGVAVALIVLVGLARIVLHAHWPSDVLGGWLLGLSVVVAAGAIADRIAAPETSLLERHHVEQARRRRP